MNNNRKIFKGTILQCIDDSLHYKIIVGHLYVCLEDIVRRDGTELIAIADEDGGSSTAFGRRFKIIMEPCYGQ